MNSVNMLAEFVEVDAAHIETPMSHHGMERPERKKSLASRPARRAHTAAMPKSTAKNSPMARKSSPFMFIRPDYTKTDGAKEEINTQNNYNKCEETLHKRPAFCYNRDKMKAKVLVILPSDKFLHRQILEGVLAYGHERGPWQFHFETGERYEQGMEKVRSWGCGGIIAMVRDPGQLRKMLNTKVPAVFINPPQAGRRMSAPPKWATFVSRNQEDVGKSAAEYFLERGYRAFAFVGTQRPTPWCERRLRGFRGRLAREGLGCAVFPGAPACDADDFDREAPHVAKWLKTLKPGTALYASRDRRAVQMLNLCIDLGISVPDGLAVLGTDNDEVLCESVTPSLSSIALDGRNAGMLCARLLDMHMRGRKAEPLVDLAFPRVVTRQSTDETLVPDAFIAKALAIVRRDLSVRRTIADIAAELHVSRRTLETKANLVLGTTLKDEMNRIRLNEAVRLISNTRLSIQDVAERCGFCCSSHLNSRFKAAFGYSPSVFRYRNPR